ncbi:MAG: glycosyltransferase [Euryarchaeota archaeon]|nr:glycosyltransferase [Euryarchaeota archaeon]
MKKNHSEMPLIGFISLFDNLGETYPLVAIAKKYIELGGQAIFFGYGTKYQHLAKDIGCKVINLAWNLSEKELKKLTVLQNKLDKRQLFPEKIFSQSFHKDFYESYIISITKEVKAFKDTDVKLIVTGADYLPNISARIANITLVYIVSGTVIPAYYQQNLASFPDNYENFFIRLVPGFIKNRLANWFILNNKSSVKEFNRLARMFNTPRINHFLDLFSGDYTLIADDIDFLILKPTVKFPRENYVGPIINSSFFEEDGHIDSDVEMHLKRSGKSILLTVGSGFPKKLFFKILETLNQTDYNVIATYTTILNENELPDLNDNILLKKFIKNIPSLNKRVALAIIHGGRGTMYTAAYSGKPVIGIPMHIEQQCNIDNLVRHGSAIRLSKRDFNEKKLLTAINKIFTNYDAFLKNAQSLKEKLQEPRGAENAAKRLLEIIEKERI